MPELRKDPIGGRWVIIATERGVRPKDYTVTRRPLSADNCPFCPGREAATPPEVLAFRPQGGEPNQPGWNVRVIPNKFPALKIEGARDNAGVGLYDMMNGIGAHEVIIETASHEQSLADLSVKDIRDVLWAYRHRMVDLSGDHRFRSAVVFKNHGASAGASLAHAHSQLIALPIVTHLVAEEMEGAKRFYDFKDRCIYCDIIDQELRDGDRVVHETEKAIAIAPFASRSPFETWILPRRHADSFERGPTDAYEDVARTLRVVLRKLRKALDDPSYNFMLHTTPFHQGPQPHYHWHIEIIPMLTNVAGFEWGSGFHINPTPPEKAAEFLRLTEIEF
jgi:UDPglucose--hexose-1-phosphate uridylyltransferase